MNMLKTRKTYILPAFKPIVNLRKRFGPNDDFGQIG
jgi:hypothetical protein